MRRVWVLAVVAACGRVGFNELADAPRDDTCPVGALVCEDFETDTPEWSEFVIGSGATVGRTAERPHRGRFALESRVPMIRDGARAALTQQFPLQASGVLATRVWVRAIQPLINHDHVFTWYRDAPSVTVSAGGDDLGNWAFNESTPTTGLVDHQSSTRAVVDVWMCVELVVTFGSPTKTQLYIDDVLLLDDVIPDPAPGYTWFDVGIARADVGGAHAVVDDVVVANATRIGCL